ncbi:hypothetical protein HUJ05_004837 [Dendroctonus ponderosae]|nr:hypothetical protein HUJ05_004837 [Dendroctonus ponderosae]
MDNPGKPGGPAGPGGPGNFSNTVMEDAISNYTVFEDAFNEADVNYNSDLNAYVVEYIISIGFYIISTLRICSSGLCSYAICKFKCMRTRTNYILLNCLICVIAQDLVMAVFHLLSTKITYFSSPNIFSNFLLILYIFQINTFLLYLLLALDWYLSANCNFIFNKYKKAYTFFIGSAYLVSIASVLSFPSANIIIMMVTYFVSALIVAILYIIRFVKIYPPASLKISYALTVSVIYVLFWSPFMVVITTLHIVILYLEIFSFHASTLPYITSIVFLFLGYIAPFFIVIILRKLDKNFKIAYELVFRSTVRKYRPSNPYSDCEYDQYFNDSDVL